MNQIIVSGKLTRKPELKQTKNGKSITDFCIAVNRGIKDEQGNYICDFVNCRCWNKTAENLTNYQDKGDYIVVQGRLVVDKYTDKDGNNKITTYVLAENVEFTPRKKTDAPKTTHQEEPNPLDPRNIQFTDEELPFLG